MKKTKEGVSLIVLVITIIVMLVLAGAVILALSNSVIIGKVSLAKVEMDLSALRDEVNVKRGERELKGQDIKGTYKLSEWGITNSTYEDRVIITAGELRVSNNGKDDEIEKAAAKLDILLKTGNTALTNTTGTNLINYRVYGNSIQSDIPSPNNLVNIQGLGDLVTDTKDVNYGKYKVPVKVSGRNLLDISKLTFTSSTGAKNLKITKNTFSFKRVSTRITSHVYVDMYFEVGAYTISGLSSQSDGLIGGFGIYDLDKNDYLVNNSSRGMKANTFVIPESKTYRVSFFCNYNSPESTEVTYSNIMLVKEDNILGNVEGERLYYDTTETKNGVTFFDDGSGAITVNGTATDKTMFCVKAKLYLDKTKKYYLLGSPAKSTYSTTYIIISFWNGTSWVAEKGEYASKGLLLDLSSYDFEFDSVKIYIFVKSGTTVNDFKYLPTLIEKRGDGTETYVPYIQPKIYDIYLTKPLMKAGGISDYIDFNDKKVVRRVGTISINGTENWVRNTVYSTDDMLVGQLRIADMKSGTSSVISNRFRYALPTIINSTRAAAKYLFIAMSTSEIKDVSKLKEWLNQNNVNAFYELENEMEESIKLPNISTQKGGTTISVVGENGVSASNIEVEY